MPNAKRQMASGYPTTGRSPWLGRLLITLGVVGIVTGVVPFSAMPGWLPGGAEPPAGPQAWV